MPTPRSLISSDELREWLVLYLARLIGVPPHSIDPSFSFELYGLDSTAAVCLSGDLSEWLGIEFDTAVAYDYPSIDALHAHVVERLASETPREAS